MQRGALMVHALALGGRVVFVCLSAQPAVLTVRPD